MPRPENCCNVKLPVIRFGVRRAKPFQMKRTDPMMTERRRFEDTLWSTKIFCCMTLEGRVETDPDRSRTLRRRLRVIDAIGRANRETVRSDIGNIGKFEAEPATRIADADRDLIVDIIAL